MSKNQFSVGDRCQWQDFETDEITAGVIDSLIPSKKPKPSNWWKFSEEEQLDFVTYANVKWDDATEDAVDVDDLMEEDSELEKQFRQTASMALKKIKAKLAEASAALGEAVALSEKYGVPFDTGVSFVSQSYNPDSTSEKFPDVDSSFINEVTGASNEYGYDGWEHSQVC